MTLRMVNKGNDRCTLTAAGFEQCTYFTFQWITIGDKRAPKTSTKVSELVEGIKVHSQQRPFTYNLKAHYVHTSHSSAVRTINAASVYCMYRVREIHQ